MDKTIIHTDNAPAAVGPYSQAIQAGDLLFTAGQIALDPATGRLVEGDVTVQTHRVLQNLRAVLEEAGTDLDHVVKTTVFLADMGDYGAVNAVYAHYFDRGKPARSAVQVAALPLGAQVEIEAIAIIQAEQTVILPPPDSLELDPKQPHMGDSGE